MGTILNINLKMPYIVVVVDEMSDLMLVAGKEIENYIQKLSQMAETAGIHIIMWLKDQVLMLSPVQLNKFPNKSFISSEL